MSDATVRTVGLIGGLSWESTATYYAEINRGVRDALGGLHSARLLLHSFDFAEIQALQNEAGWPEAGRRLAEAGRALEGAGADVPADLRQPDAQGRSGRGGGVLRSAAAHRRRARAARSTAGGSKRPLLLATQVR